MITNCINKISLFGNYWCYTL